MTFLISVGKGLLLPTITYNRSLAIENRIEKTNTNHPTLFFGIKNEIMTPKEKANQLIEKINVQSFSQERGWQTDTEQTKDIAIVLIDEFIDACEWWDKVKDEIKKIK